MPRLQRFKRYVAYSSILLMHLTVAWSFPSDAEAGGKTAKQITACDRLAEHREDQNRRFEGVAWSDLSPAIAEALCVACEKTALRSSDTFPE
jgi:hypothetical protein